MDDRKFHPAAEIFPLMEGDDFDQLVEDIKAKGLREPIVVLPSGEIIDGRNRWRACKAAAVEPKYEEWEPTEKVSIVAYVMSLNLYRRHLTQSQLGMVAARAREMFDQQAKERKMQAGERFHKGSPKVVVTLPQPSEPPKARDLAGKAAGVSGTYVDYGTKVITAGIPELAKAVDDGKVVLPTAAKIAQLPSVDQKPALEARLADPPARGRKTDRPSTQPTTRTEPPPDDDSEDDAPAAPAKLLGVGIFRANEAINSLSRIPKNDALRKRGFQLVSDWLKTNK